jgi:hypothetical protein
MLCNLKQVCKSESRDAFDGCILVTRATQHVVLVTKSSLRASENQHRRTWQFV